MAGKRQRSGQEDSKKRLDDEAKARKEESDSESSDSDSESESGEEKQTQNAQAESDSSDDSSSDEEVTQKQKVSKNKKKVSQESSSEEEDQESSSEDEDAKPVKRARKAEENDVSAAKPASKKQTSSKEESSDDDDDDDDDGSEGDLDVYTVYIEGIPYETSSDDLWTLFSSVGTLIDLRLPRWNDSGRLRGYGHADYGTEKEMQACIKKLDRHELGKRYLRVTEAKSKAKSSQQPGAFGRPSNEVPENCTTLFVKNLPYDADESMIEESFLSFGKVQNIRLARWNHTGRSKGFGYVHFASSDAVKAVLNQKTPLYVGERAVVVDADVEGGGRPKGSFRDASGRQWNKTASVVVAVVAEAVVVVEAVVADVDVALLWTSKEAILRYHEDTLSDTSGFSGRKAKKATPGLFCPRTTRLLMANIYA